MAGNQSVKDYQERLARVGRAAAIAGFTEVVRGGREIGNAMKAAVPRESGALADSIRMDIDPGQFRVYLKAGGPTTTTPQGTDYALHQEYGTSDQPANPFFWPTWRLHKRQVRARINKAMKTAMEAEMAKP